MTDSPLSIQNLIQHNVAWLSGEGPESDIVLSSRVRLARNLATMRFSPAMNEAERSRTRDELLETFQAIRPSWNLSWFDVEALSDLDRRFLVERHLISREQEVESGPRGVAVDPDEAIAVMVNEEDHLRLQCLQPGLQLQQTYSQLDALDDDLLGALDIAFDDELGFLTACPTNVGTGLRASVMIHLPALVMTDHIDKALRAVHDLRLAVRGLYGEGTEAQGDLYQISNQITTGRDEGQILEDLQAAIDGLIQYEKRARERLWDNDRAAVEDRVWRAHALLQSARLINTEEAMQHLSSVRLGMYLRLIPTMQMARLNRIFLNIQPAHLQRMEGADLDASARDAARATYIRREFQPISG